MVGRPAAAFFPEKFKKKRPREGGQGPRAAGRGGGGSGGQGRLGMSPGPPLGGAILDIYWQKLCTEDGFEPFPGFHTFSAGWFFF